MESTGRRVIRFGTFEADPVASELRKGGQRISLQEQPFRLLILLLEHPGEVVTRDELRQKLWGDTFVDFEEGLNTAVRKLRDALGDSAANPRFIETLPRRGYRFIAPAELPVGEPQREAVRRRSIPWFALAGGAAFLIGAGFWLLREQPVWTPSPPTQLTRDPGLTTDPVISRDGKMLAYASDRGGAASLDIWLQHISGGEARRLAADSADDHEPDISPDGSQVVFRSERDGGGIYSVSTLGGDPKLIIKNGYLPRFSPDGSRIAFARGWFGSGGFEGRLHVYTPATGSTGVLAPNVVVAGPVAWSPDGKSLAFAGAKSFGGQPPHHLWMCSVEGGPATQLSVQPINEDRFGQIRTASVAWFGDKLIISAKHGDSSNLWAATVSQGKRQLASELRRITLGSGNEVLPSVSADGKLVFANHGYSTDIWEADLDTATTAPAMRQLTQDRALNYRPSLSADGSKMAYISNRSGNLDVWVRDLVSGSEVALTRTGTTKIFATLSRDGSQVVLWDGTNSYLASTSGGGQRLLCEKCGRPDDWSVDGKVLSRYEEPGSVPKGIAAWDPATRLMTKIVIHKTLTSNAPDLSPDGEWLTFQATDNPNRQVFIVPYSGHLTPSSSWTPVTDGKALDRDPKWSADGNRIFFLSDRDGFRCIWARNLDPKTKQPVGSIYPLVHLHNARLSLLHVPNTGNVSICPVSQKLIFTMGEISGNLWMTQLGAR